MLINLCGSGSSGTTLLSRCLDRHPDISCGDEMFLFSSPLLYENFPHFKQHPLLARLSGISGNPYHQGRAVFRNAQAYGLSRSTLWKWAKQAASFTDLVEQIQQHIIQLTGKSIWVEKTPRNIRVIALYLAHFQQAKVIHIVRDPRDVIYSLSKRGKNLLHAVESWMASVAAIQPYRDLERVYEVRYEDLCRDPENTMAAIQDFLGVKKNTRSIFSTEFESQGLGQHSGHSSWTVKPEQSFSTAAIGRYVESDIDFNQLASTRLTEAYAETLGVNQQYSLSDLARQYGYDFPSALPVESYTPFNAGWQLGFIRKKIDAHLKLSSYLPQIEIQKNLSGYNI